MKKNEMKKNENRIKVKLFQSHFARIPCFLAEKLEEIVGPRGRSAWIIQQAKKQYGLEIKTKSDFEELDRLLVHYYKDRDEWLCEKIRIELGIISEKVKDE